MQNLAAVRLKGDAPLSATTCTEDVNHKQHWGGAGDLDAKRPECTYQSSVINLEPAEDVPLLPEEHLLFDFRLRHWCQGGSLRTWRICTRRLACLRCSVRGQEFSAVLTICPRNWFNCMIC